MVYPSVSLRLTLLPLLLIPVLQAQEERKIEPQPLQTSPIPPSDSKSEGDKAVDKNATAPVDMKTYTIGPEDILRIIVLRENELSGSTAVGPEGKIVLPLLGEVLAAGLTPQELQVQLTKSLAKFINAPEVTVVIQAVRSKKYLVSGEVNKPGIYALVTPTTILEAIVNAGGLKEYANRKKILILRGTDRLYFNYKDVVEGKRMEQNILVQNKDQIFVK
jgi:polysaccharide biosynthesis/export protein